MMIYCNTEDGKIPKTIGQAVALLLMKRRGLHLKCNRKIGNGTKLCKKSAVRWYVYRYVEHHGVLTSAISLCEDHAYPPNTGFEVIIFNSWEIHSGILVYPL